MKTLILLLLAMALVLPAFAVEVNDGTVASVTNGVITGNTVTDGTSQSTTILGSSINELGYTVGFVSDKGGKYVDLTYEQNGGNVYFDDYYYPAEGKISYIPKQVGAEMYINSNGAYSIFAGAKSNNKANSDVAKVQVYTEDEGGNAYIDGWIGADSTSTTASAYGEVLIGGIMPTAATWVDGGAFTGVYAKGKKTAADTEIRDTYNDDMGAYQWADVYLDMGAKSANAKTDFATTKTVATWFVDDDWANAYDENQNYWYQQPSYEHWYGYSGSFGNGLNQVQDAIDLANPGDTVQVYEGQTPYLENLYVDKDLTINGERGYYTGDRLVNIDGSEGDWSTVVVPYGVTATLNTLQITGGFGSDVDYYTIGGGILNDGTLTVNDCEVSDNVADYGAGIYNYGTLTVKNSEIDGNYWEGEGYEYAWEGGALYNVGTATISDSQINDNWAEYGAGIYNEGTLTATNTAFFDNYADEDGGAIYNDGWDSYATTTLNNCYLGDIYDDDGNIADEDGGAIYVDGGVVNIYGGVISDNEAYDGDGGAIYIDWGTVNIGADDVAGTVFLDNYAEYDGGAIYIEDGSLNIYNSFIVNNEAYDGYGGGIYNYDGYLSMYNTQVFGNYPDDIYYW